MKTIKFIFLYYLKLNLKRQFSIFTVRSERERHWKRSANFKISLYLLNWAIDWSAFNQALKSLNVHTVKIRDHSQFYYNSTESVSLLSTEATTLSAIISQTIAEFIISAQISEVFSLNSALKSKSVTKLVINTKSALKSVTIQSDFDTDEQSTLTDIKKKDISVNKFIQHFSTSFYCHSNLSNLSFICLHMNEYLQKQN